MATIQNRLIEAVEFYEANQNENQIVRIEVMREGFRLCVAQNGAFRYRLVSFNDVEFGVANYLIVELRRLFDGFNTVADYDPA